ncbi:aldehyde dehydrogenase family protein, partial [Nocardia asiatica]|uniref:aldehyde dehydrogenase family protein n=1 Tax=Nocardia asiatica TaxID=209252 RepID=UPI00245857D8
FPFAIALSDAMPALMAGNGVVLKPDNKTALCVLFGVKLLHRAGLPRGLGFSIQLCAFSRKLLGGG